MTAKLEFQHLYVLATHQNFGDIKTVEAVKDGRSPSGWSLKVEYTSFKVLVYQLCVDKQSTDTTLSLGAGKIRALWTLQRRAIERVGGLFQSAIEVFCD